MNIRRRHYRAYLLRMWQVAEGETFLWRASLESAGTGERRGFGSLHELARWLEQETESEPPLPGLGKEEPTAKANS